MKASLNKTDSKVPVKCLGCGYCWDSTANQFIECPVCKRLEPLIASAKFRQGDSW